MLPGMPPHHRLPVPLLLLVSFVEGAAVMVIELLGAKAIAPYYGTSLYAWSSVLGVTVGALALGYLLGGGISRRYPAERSLFVLLLAGAACTLLTPFLLPLVVPATEPLGVRLGSLVAVLVYLLPPVACLGAVSPVIIQLINREVAGSGQSAGTVYAVSTTGGILATVLAGFYLIPEVGLRLTALLTGGLLGLIGAGYFLWFRAPEPGAIPVDEPPPPAPPAPPRPGALPASALLAVAFIEGAAVMVMELLGAKITAPYYGASLYVWASVLAVTLAALALGYFAGGFLSRRFPGELAIFVILFAAGLLTALSPLIAPTVFLVTDFLGVRAGSLASVLVYLLPPVACLGMVSPLVTQAISRDRDGAGQSAGTVYGISTVGGILATFLAGFYLIPELGVRLTALLAGGLLGAVAIAWCVSRGNPRLVLAGCLLAGLPVVLQPAPTENDNARVVYTSSGILGQWTILDYGPWKEKGKGPVERRLLLNGIDQTITQVGSEPVSVWAYAHKIAAYASMKPEGSKALLLGMGGGSIAHGLVVLGMDLDIVELDERIRYITEKYFAYDRTASRLYIDDARHYIRNTGKKYDLVVIDMVIGEVQPTHVFSLEGFADLKRILNDDALVIINYQGKLDTDGISAGPRSIYRTLEAAGFHVSYHTLNNQWDPAEDIFFVASLQPQDYRTLMRDLRYNKWVPYANFAYDNMIREDGPRLDGAVLLTDDRPKLELLNAANILAWRKHKIEQHTRQMIVNGMPIYP